MNYVSSLLCFLTYYIEARGTSWSFGYLICKGYREKTDCIVCLEMRADELMRRLISGELTNYKLE